MFAASKSGASKFSINNAGNVTINNFTTNGGLIYTNGSGLLSQITTQGTAADCLLSNGAGAVPTFGPCDTSPGVNLWNQQNGILYPKNSTVDLVIGGTSTTSAKFAITNLNGSASPIASLSATTSSGGSGTGLVLDSSTSSLQSLLGRSLTL